MSEPQLKQCSVCEIWTRNYINVESGNRNPRTGETPVDNVVCVQCQREARAFSLLNKAADRWLLSIDTPHEFPGAFIAVGGARRAFTFRVGRSLCQIGTAVPSLRSCNREVTA